MSPQNRENPANGEKGGERSGRPALSEPKGFLLAFICVGLALFLRLGFDSLWQEKLPYMTFFLAVFVVAQFCGVRPVLATIIAGFLLANWFFVAPRHSLLIHGALNRINGAFYFLFSVLVLMLSMRAQRAVARLREAHAALQRKVEELRASEARYAAVFEEVARLAAIVQSSSDAIICTSLDGTILTWNSAAEHLYGYAASEAVGKTVGMLFPQQGGAGPAPDLERVGRGEQINHFDTTQRAKDGRQIEVSLSVSPVRDRAGKIAGASTIARDINDRRITERERERLVGELQTALAEVKTLSGLLPICSHCKKIRDDQGYWNQLEVFIGARSKANFTHSICPDCTQSLYPGLLGDQSNSG